MMSCREVAVTLLSSSDGSHWHRVQVRLHLMMCQRCSAFRDQLKSITEAARTIANELTAELPNDFEVAVTTRVLRSVPPDAP